MTYRTGVCGTATLLVDALQQTFASLPVPEGAAPISRNQLWCIVFGGKPDGIQLSALPKNAHDITSDVSPTVADLLRAAMNLALEPR